MNPLIFPRPRVLARALALLLAGVLSWGAQAHAATACKTSAQKASKACVQKDKATQSKTQSKSKASASAQHKAASKAGSSTRASASASASAKACTSAKTKAAKRRCAAASKTTNSSSTGAAGPGIVAAPALKAAPGTGTASAAASPCFAALASSQASQNMADKVPFLAGQPPQAEQLANAGRPSKKEQTELSSLIAGYQMCHDMSPPASGSDAGSPAQLDDAQWRAAKSVLNDLQAGRLSYGAAARALAQPGASAAP